MSMSPPGDVRASKRPRHTAALVERLEGQLTNMRAQLELYEEWNNRLHEAVRTERDARRRADAALQAQLGRISSSATAAASSSARRGGEGGTVAGSQRSRQQLQLALSREQDACRRAQSEAKQLRADNALLREQLQRLGTSVSQLETDASTLKEAVGLSDDSAGEPTAPRLVDSTKTAPTTAATKVEAPDGGGPGGTTSSSGSSNDGLALGFSHASERHYTVSEGGALLTAKLGTDFRPCVCAAAPMVMRLDDGSAARWYVELEVQTVPRDAAYLGVARPALAQAVAIEEGEDYGAEYWQQEEEGMERWGVRTSGGMLEMPWHTEDWDGMLPCAKGDTLGLLLDARAGSLALYQNGQQLGMVMESGLSGNLVWVAALSRADSWVRIAAKPPPPPAQPQSA